MSYRLINANDLAMKYPEVNDMPCIYADLPNGLDGTHHYLASSVQSKTKWIPVSEGLPKSHGTYTVSRYFGNVILTSACYFDGIDTWYNDNRINHDRDYVTDKVVAWMPKPEPYKAESEDKR